MSACPPAGPITPQQEEERQHKCELPAPKALDVQFSGLCVATDEEAGSPRSPFASSGSDGQQQQRGGQQRDTDSETCSSPGSGSGGKPVAAAGCSPPEAEWQRANHDRKEPILQANNERFCLLPVK